MKSNLLKMGVVPKLWKLCRCFGCSAIVQQAKGPRSPQSPTIGHKQEARLEWENEMMYGPVISSDTPKSERASNTLPDIRTEHQSTVLDMPPTIPNVNVSRFPLKTVGVNSENLCEAASELLDKNNAVLSTTVKNSASVTSILQRTMPAESVAVLDRWRRQMIANLGMEGFAKYQEETFQTGAALHKSIHDFLRGQLTPDSQMDSRICGHWNSIISVLKEIRDVVTLEEKFVHPYLRYHGIADCIAKHRNRLVLIEWKTSQKPKPLLRHTYDNPLQVAAYMGAYNAVSQEHTQLDSGIIVVCYPDGTPAHIHIMNPEISQKAWESWLLRLREFWHFQNQTNQGTNDLRNT